MVMSSTSGWLGLFGYRGVLLGILGLCCFGGLFVVFCCCSFWFCIKYNFEQMVL